MLPECSERPPGLCSQSEPQDNIGSAPNSSGKEHSLQSFSEKKSGIHFLETGPDRVLELS